MLKPITCGQCRKAVGWYDTKFYNVVKPEMPAGVTVLVAVLECVCGARRKFNGIADKKREEKAKDRHRVGIQIPFVVPDLAAAVMIVKTDTKPCGCVDKTTESGGRYWSPCLMHDPTEAIEEMFRAK